MSSKYSDRSPFSLDRKVELTVQTDRQSLTFKQVADFVDAVRRGSNVKSDSEIEMVYEYDTSDHEIACFHVDLNAPWNMLKEPEYLDHPVTNGTVVLIDEAAIAGTNVPVMFATLARERAEIHLGVRPTHKHSYGRVQDDGNVLIPGLGVYAPHAFRVIRLLRESDG